MTDELMLQQGVATKNIGDKQYSLTLMGATDALVTMKELIKLVSLPVGSAWDSGIITKDVLQDLDVGKNLAMALTSALDKTDVVTLIKRLVHGLQENGKVVEFDTYFRGQNLGKLPVFISWSIEANGINPSVFMKGFSEVQGVDFSQILSTMSQTKNKENTPKESQS